MSDQLNALIAEIATLAEAEGTDKNALLDSVRAALGLAVQAPDIWNADGTSKPNELGLIRIRQLEERRDQLLHAGEAAAAKLIPDWWACWPGLAQLPQYSRYWWQDLVEVSEAGNIMANPFDAAVVNKWKEGNPNSPLPSEQFIEIRGEAVDNAGAIPGTCKTVDDCIGYIMNRVAQYLRDNSIPAPAGVDFSPAKP